MQPTEIDRLYQEGVAALRAGDKATGREKLMQVVEADQLHENAWLWLSGAVETSEERIICLENVLTINPRHEKARQALIKLGGEPPPLGPSAPSEAVDQAADLPPDEAWRRPLLEKRAAAPGPAVKPARKLVDVDAAPPDDEGPRQPIPRLSPRLLIESWFAAAMLIKYDYEREWATFGRVLVNVLIGSLLSWGGSVLLTFVTLKMPRWMDDAVNNPNIGKLTDPFTLSAIELTALFTLLGIIFAANLIWEGAFSFLLFTMAQFFKGEGGYLQNLHTQAIAGTTQRIMRLVVVLLLLFFAAAIPADRLVIVYLIAFGLWGAYTIALRVNAISSANPNFDLNLSLFTFFGVVGGLPAVCCMVTVVIPWIIQTYTSVNFDFSLLDLIGIRLP